MRILFIEDDIITIDPIVEFLRINKHVVEVVSDANEAVDRIESSKYDLIFCDIMLPSRGYFTLEETFEGRYTGLRLLEHIRKREREMAQSPNQIILTNWRNEPEVDVVAKAQNARILRKPISLELIEEIIIA